MSRFKLPGQLISIPWPIRLFGDLQEGLGLPAIVAALDLRSAVVAKARSDSQFTVSGHGMTTPVVVEPGGDTDFVAAMPAFAAALQAVARKKLSLKCGYDFTLHTRVPGLADLNDGAIGAVLWVVTLLALGGGMEELAAEEVAAMVMEVVPEREGEPWGAPEIHGAILGGLQYIAPGETPRDIGASRPLNGFVVGYAPEGRAPERARAARQAAVALEPVAATLGVSGLGEAGSDDVLGCLGQLPEEVATLAYAHMVIRDHCRAAHALLENDAGFDDDRLGELIDGSHEMLRDYLGARCERVESLIEAAASAGALGCKAVPGTKCLVAFAPGHEDAVAEAIRKAGGEAHQADIGDGMRIDA